MHVCAQDSDEQIQVEDLSQGGEQISPYGPSWPRRCLPREAVPLFFDDPFVSADDAPAWLLDTFRELSKSTQVVLFSEQSGFLGHPQQKFHPDDEASPSLGPQRRSRG